MTDRIRSTALRSVARLTRRAPVRGVERVLRRAYPPERHRHGVEDVVSIGDGLLFRASTSSFLEWRVFFLARYEPEIAALLPALVRPGRTAVDVGAHAGIHTLRMARLASRGLVVACEPNPAVFERLRGNVELNRLTNVRLHRVALLDTSGETALYVPDPRSASNEGAASLSSRGADGAEVLPVSVRTTTLDELMDAEPGPGVDVIKIDVEGFEAAVLAGARTVLERDQPSLIFEYSAALWEHAGFDLPRLEEELRSLGYTTSPLSIIPRGLIPTSSGLPHFENLVVLSPRLEGEPRPNLGRLGR